MEALSESQKREEALRNQLEAQAVSKGLCKCTPLFTERDVEKKIVLEDVQDESDCPICMEPVWEARQ